MVIYGGIRHVLKVFLEYVTHTERAKIKIALPTASVS